MGSNYIAEDATITPSIACIHDSATGFAADFSRNGNVDGWEYYDGIHTYGAWGGFLFGTLYEEYGTIGRFNVFRPVDAVTHYNIRLTMKYNPWPRDERGIHPLPTQGKIRWRTLQDSNWDSSKEMYFDMEADNKWHTYIINVGIAQWWVGDVNDLRIWPSVTDGEDGDEFFIRAIDIFSTESHKCRNTSCEKFFEYSHPCPWIGLRATCESEAHESDKRFDIDDLSELVININGYGNEIVKIKEIVNSSGRVVANQLAKSISRTNVGGYAEVQVEYTEDDTFKIHSGTRYLKFSNILGQGISTKTSGETPVDGYVPLSSFKIKTNQAFGLLDNNERTSIVFNPFQYSIEGGRRDWLGSSTGIMRSAIGENDGDSSTQTVRKYFVISNDARTIIDYNHPFNASGRIKKIWIMCTLDNPDYVKTAQETGAFGVPTEDTRKGSELSDAKVMIVRPKRDGTMEVIYEWDLNNRDPDRSYNDALYSLTQEGIDLDVDVFINKGDLIAVYNAHMYVGKSISGYEYDCQFYQLDFKPEIGDTFDPERLYGDGSSGLLVYARGVDPQRRLYLDIDLGHRYNIEKLEVKGEAQNNILEYNIASCLDINWKCDLFGEQHWTSHRTNFDGFRYWYQRPNTYYGLDKLNDNVYSVPDGLACDSYSLVGDGTGPYSHQSGSDRYNYSAGAGVVPTNPHYFWVNGDEEWLGVWLHAQGSQSSQAGQDFDSDPIAIYMYFPFEKQKKIHKLKMYFKEKFNFRSFGLSTYGGFNYFQGDADDYHYDLISEYTKIILDGVEFYNGSPTYGVVSDYLFNNPCIGNIVASPTSDVVYEWDPVYSDLIQDFSAAAGYGSDSGFFTYQTFSVDNPDAWAAARKTDWQTIQHDWEPVLARGFRIYCDFHKSTKINEIELYAVAEDTGSNLSGSIVTTFSDYKDIW